MKQFSTTVRNGWLSRYESDIGTSPKLRMMTGGQPATCATAQSGTQLIQMTLPSDWMAAPSGGAAALAGTWSGTVSVDGTAGYYRILDSSATTCHEQGLITRAFSLTTNATTDAFSNILNFAATTGVTAGMGISGTGIPAGATVLDTTSTTITISLPCEAGVGSGVVIYIGDTTGDMWLSSIALTATQGITILSRSLIAPGA